ncbi:MAG: hypothetical protein RLO52_44515 [Sandaracinaceae bacterium]
MRPVSLLAGVLACASFGCSESHGSLTDAGSPACPAETDYSLSRELLPSVDPTTSIWDLSESDVEAYCAWKRAHAGSDYPMCPDGTPSVERYEDCVASLSREPIMGECQMPAGLLIECTKVRLDWCVHGADRSLAYCACDRINSFCGD